jgi:uncharacterized protein (DUF2267 family)
MQAVLTVCRPLCVAAPPPSLWFRWIALVNPDEFAALIAKRLECDLPRADAVVRAVLATVRDGLDDAEAREVANLLPAPMLALWPERGGERPELPESGGRGFLEVVRERAGLKDDLAAGHAIRAVFRALMESGGVVTRRGAWDGLRHLPPGRKSIWMRIFRSANFPVERLAQRP